MKNENPQDKKYIFTLMRNGEPIAIYIGDTQLSEEVVNHEFSTRQMRNILYDNGYRLMVRS